MEGEKNTRNRIYIMKEDYTAVDDKRKLYEERRDWRIQQRELGRN